MYLHLYDTASIQEKPWKILPFKLQVKEKFWELLDKLFPSRTFKQQQQPV